MKLNVAKIPVQVATILLTLITVKCVIAVNQPATKHEKSVINILTKIGTSSNNHDARYDGHKDGAISVSPGADIKTSRPVIGVLTQVLRDYKTFSSQRHFHLVASYVKWLEMAGARVMPILLNQDDDYYIDVFHQTNGLLFPGGDNLMDPSKRTPMLEASKMLFKLASEANDRGDYYPIWGTCLGFELLTVLPSNKNTLVGCSATDMNLTVDFVEDRGKMFAKQSSYMDIAIDVDFAKAIQTMMQKNPLGYNYHHMCVTDASLKEAKLEEYFRVLGYSTDPSGNRFAAIFEARNYPYFGVTFHPEKTAFEFENLGRQKYIPHSRQAIAVARYFADFFVGQAELNGHQFDENSAKFRNQLIYAYSANYTAAQVNDIYELRYFFPWKSDARGINSDEEFVDRQLKPDEEVYEYNGGKKDKSDVKVIS